MNIKKVISHRLIVNKYSRYKLASALNITPASVYRFLSEEQKVIGVDKLIKIGDIIGISDYKLLLGVSESKELIDFLTLDNADLSFQKAVLYDFILTSSLQGNNGLSEFFKSFAKYISYDSIVDKDCTEQFVSLFLRDFFLFSKEKSKIVESFLESKRSLWNLKSFDLKDYIPFETDLESLRRKFKSEREEHLKYFEGFKIGVIDPLLLEHGFNYLQKLATFTFIWQLDLYFYYITDKSISAKIIELLDEISDFVSLVQGDFKQADHFLFQLFNYGEYSGSLLNTCNDLFNPGLKSVTTYSSFYSSNFSDEKNILHGEVFVPYSLSSEVLLGLVIKQTSMEKEYPINSIAIIECDGGFNNGDTVALSINNEAYILSKIHILTDRVLVEFVGNGIESSSQMVFERNQVNVLGRVIYGIIL